MVDLREKHESEATVNGKSPKVGDVVTVYEEGTKIYSSRKRLCLTMLDSKMSQE